LVGELASPRALGVEDASLDATDALAAFGRDQAIRQQDVCGCIFMTRSPSCGLYSVPVHDWDGKRAYTSGRGAFARAVSNRHQRLPVEENGRLFDAAIRESFLVRVFTYAHWRRLVEAGVTPARLMEFHSRYKMLLMAHSVPNYRESGRLLGTVGRNGWRSEPEPSAQASARKASDRIADEDLSDRYLGCLMDGFGKPATRGGHANVLSHLSGYLRPVLDGDARQEMADIIEAYRQGAVPLSQPREQIWRHAQRHQNPYLIKQIYLRPPWEADAERRSTSHQRGT